MNELLLAGSSLASALFTTLMWKLGKNRLYAAIIVFLILIASVGGKLVPVFGHVTNSGNIFYASVFLCTYFLIERFGRRAGIYSIVVGVTSVFFFSLLVWMTLISNGAAEMKDLNGAMWVVYGAEPRIALASLVAFTLSQTLNVYLYIFLKQRMEGRNLWLRANLSNALAQALDSVIFFTLAFSGILPSGHIVEIITTGFLLKVAFMALAAPLLYLNNVEEDDDSTVRLFSITIR